MEVSASVPCRLSITARPLTTVLLEKCSLLLTGDGPVCCVDMITRLPQLLH